MSDNRIATVIGGGGFIGRYVVQALVRAGFVVRVGSRRPDRLRGLDRLGPPGRVVPVYATLRDVGTLRAAFAGAEVGVNLVSILAETRRATFAAINAEGAGRAARCAAEAGIERYVHVSAIGASAGSPAEYGRTKARGEALVRKALPGAGIVRPSVVFGPEDRFLNMFALMSRFSPVLPVFCGETRFQPVYVGDVAEAVARLLREDAKPGQTIEAGGPDVLTMTELMRFILEVTGRRRPMVQVPLPVAELEALVFEHLPGKLLTRDQLAMLQHDNIVSSEAKGLESLEIEARSMRQIAPGYLR